MAGVSCLLLYLRATQTIPEATSDIKEATPFSTETRRSEEGSWRLRLQVRRMQW